MGYDWCVIVFEMRLKSVAPSTLNWNYYFQERFRRSRNITANGATSADERKAIGGKMGKVENRVKSRENRKLRGKLK